MCVCVSMETNAIIGIRNGKRKYMFFFVFHDSRTQYYISEYTKYGMTVENNANIYCEISIYHLIDLHIVRWS